VLKIISFCVSVQVLGDGDFIATLRVPGHQPDTHIFLILILTINGNEFPFISLKRMLRL